MTLKQPQLGDPRRPQAGVRPTEAVPADAFPWLHTASDLWRFTLEQESTCCGSRTERWPIGKGGLEGGHLGGRKNSGIKPGKEDSPRKR